MHWPCISPLDPSTLPNQCDATSPRLSIRTGTFGRAVPPFLGPRPWLSCAYSVWTVGRVLSHVCPLRVGEEQNRTQWLTFTDRNGACTYRCYGERGLGDQHRTEMYLLGSSEHHSPPSSEPRTVSCTFLPLSVYITTRVTHCSSSNSAISSCSPQGSPELSSSDASNSGTISLM